MYIGKVIKYKKWQMTIKTIDGTIAEIKNYNIFQDEDDSDCVDVNNWIYFQENGKCRIIGNPYEPFKVKEYPHPNFIAFTPRHQHKRTLTPQANVQRFSIGKMQHNQEVSLITGSSTQVSSYMFDDEEEAAMAKPGNWLYIENILFLEENAGGSYDRVTIIPSPYHIPPPRQQIESESSK
jgi:hypothetical protein